MNWRGSPQFKVEVSGETYVNDVAFNIILKRPENNVSYLALSVDDYKSRRYMDVFDTFDTVDLSLHYGNDTWTKVFSGTVTSPRPKLSIDGEVLAVGAWGKGRALVDTHCDEAYGAESMNNGDLDRPHEIIEDLITNHINKEFGGAASGYSVGDKVETITYPDGGPNTLSVTHLNSQYFNNFVNVNNVCSLTNAYAQGLGTPEVSIHWFVDPSANLYVKKIDDDHSDGNWSRYYGGSQANATLEVAKDMILYDFTKNVEEYANSIVLSSLLRKPAEDWITELNPSPGGTGGSQLWGGAGGSTGITDTAVAGEFIVGANAVKQTTNGAVTQLRYPSGQAAAWDFNNIGSENNIPTVNFYLRTNPTLLPFGSADFHAYTAVAASYYYDFALDVTVNAKWYHFSFPLGQFNTRSKQGPDFEWVVTGNPSWSNINWFEIEWDAANLDWICIDDFHMSGIIVREARDTSEITAHNLHQKVLRNDAAVDDSMKSGTPGTTDLGTAAQLAYAELLRRSQTPIVASIQIPMLPDLLPGQTLHIHACKQSNSGTCAACGAAGTFRIAQDFRVKDLQHQIIAPGGFRTLLNLTSDVTNTHSFGVPTRYSLLKQYAGALGHSEARNLKGARMDNLVPRLSENY